MKSCQVIASDKSNLLRKVVFLLKSSFQVIAFLTISEVVRPGRKLRNLGNLNILQEGEYCYSGGRILLFGEGILLHVREDIPAKFLSHDFPSAESSFC